MKCKHKEACGYDFCLEEECPEYETVPETNADRIRAMSGKEMARFLCNFRSDTEGGYPCSKCVAAEYCRAGHNGMIDWLKQPAEVIDLIKRAQSVEVVRKGRWIFIDSGNSNVKCYYQCSYCKKYSDGATDYCPHCGADMSSTFMVS